MVWASPQATAETPFPSRSLISVGLPLSLKVRVPSCPQLLLPHAYTVASDTAMVCWAPAATHMICYRAAVERYMQGVGMMRCSKG